MRVFPCKKPRNALGGGARLVPGVGDSDKFTILRSESHGLRFRKYDAVRLRKFLAGVKLPRTS
jgi:hypothetical protein